MRIAKLLKRSSALVGAVLVLALLALAPALAVLLHSVPSLSSPGTARSDGDLSSGGGAPRELLAAAAAALGPAFPRGALYAAAPACRAPIVFRYDFGSGGYGDCLKGLVAVAQLAYVLGCPFVADFSRHPFGAALPFAAPTVFAAANEGDALLVHMGDWTTRAHRLAARDALFNVAMAPPTIAL